MALSSGTHMLHSALKRSLIMDRARKEKKRKDYAFRRQFNEKPSIIPGCPGGQGNPFMLHTHFKTSKFALGVLVSTTTDGQNRHASNASCVRLTRSAYAMLTVHCRLTSSAKLQTVSSSWTRSSKLPYLGPVKGATWLTWGSR